MRIEVHASSSQVDVYDVPLAEAKLLLAMRQVPREQAKSLLRLGGDVPMRKANAAGAEVVARFTAANPIPVRQRVSFGSYFAAFILWLPEQDRAKWYRARFRHALPFDYVSLPGTANQKFIHRLAEPLIAPLASAAPSLDLQWSMDVGSHLAAS